MTFDRQAYSDVCDHCRESFQVVRGSVFDDGNGIALYLAAMHGCDARRVDLAIAIREGYAGSKETLATFMKVRPRVDEVQMTVVDPTNSCWTTEDYLGRSLTRDEALTSPLIDSFFHIADQLVAEIPELRAYLAR